MGVQITMKYADFILLGKLLGVNWLAPKVTLIFRSLINLQTALYDDTNLHSY